LEAAALTRDLSVAAARGIVLDTMRAAVFVGRFATQAGTADVGRAALGMPLAADAPRSVEDELLDGLALYFLDEHAQATPHLRTAIRVLDDASSPSRNLRSLDFGCWAAMAIGDLDHLDRLSQAFDARARQDGAYVTLGSSLHYRTLAAIERGSLQDATYLAAEARDV